MSAKEEGVSNKPKRVLVLEAVLALLPNDPLKLVDSVTDMVFDLREFAKEAKMERAEFERFLMHTNMFRLITDAENQARDGKYMFGDGYETVEDVMGTLKIAAKTGRNDVVRRNALSKSGMDKRLGRK